MVYGSTGKHDHGSSKIKLKNIVDYKWEVKNYMGRLIAIHIGGEYVAYAIKGKLYPQCVIVIGTVTWTFVGVYASRSELKGWRHGACGESR